MTLATLITRAYLLATGKATPPTSGTNKYSKLVGLANVCQDMWQSEPDTEWDSLYMTVTLSGTITDTDTFALGNSIREVSHREGDYVRAVHTDDNETQFLLVKPNQLQDYATDGLRVVARVGSNLVFSIPFQTTDPEYGGRIKVPCYGFVSTLANDSDIIQVDNPLWLCYMVAAEYCRTDMTLNYRTDDLVSRANEVMTDMKQSQDANRSEPIRTFSPLGRSW